MSTPSPHEPPPDAPADNSPAGWTVLFFLPAIWLIPCLIFTVVIAFLTGLAFLPPAWIATPVAALFVAYSADRFLHKRRAMHAHTVLGYLDYAVRLNLPLDPILRAAQESERGSTRRQIAHLRDALQSGYPLHEAVADAVPDLPRDVAATLAAAEPIGQLQPALSRLIDNERQERDNAPADADRVAYLRLYPLGLILIILSSITLLSIFVLPKFREIFKDFGVSLPPIAENVMGVSTFMTENVYLMLFLSLGLFLAIYAPMSFYLHRIILPFWRLPDVGGVVAMIRWWIPILHSIERNRGMALTTEFLAHATAAGVPFSRAVERTLYLPTNTFFRTKLRAWTDLMDAGEAPGTAARKARLPELFSSLLTPGAGAGSADEASLPAMFSFLARYYHQRFSRAVILFWAAVEPAIVLLFGAIVLFVISSIVLSLVTLINSVIDTYPTSHL